MENAASCAKIVDQLVWFQFVEVNSNFHLQVLKDSSSVTAINKLHFFGWVRSAKPGLAAFNACQLRSLHVLCQMAQI